MLRAEPVSERVCILAVAGLCALAGAAHAEEALRPPLRFVQTIVLPGVSGRIDHLAIDLKGQRLFVAALANDTVEVVDLRTGKRARTIAGLREPQGIAFVPDHNRLFVTNGGNGTLSIFDGASLEVIGRVTFSGDADNLRYDENRQRLYVGYGNGALGTLDPASGERLGDTKLQGHPESFQVEPSGARIFVNVPAANAVEVIDRHAGHVVATWPVREARANFPMALAAGTHRLFVGCRKPPKLVVFDTESGKAVAALDTVADADDVFYDAVNRRVYISGGEGFIQVLRKNDPDHYEPLARIATRVGARTSLLVPALGRLYLAVPNHRAEPAEIRVYGLEP